MNRIFIDFYSNAIEALALLIFKGVRASAPYAAGEMILQLYKH